MWIFGPSPPEIKIKCTFLLTQTVVFWMRNVFAFYERHIDKQVSFCQEFCCGQLWVRHMFCGRDLWWTIPLHIFHWSFWDTLWIPNDHICRSAPSTFLFRVHFGESLVFRLYSEIDHLLLRSVSHLLPLGDCETVSCEIVSTKISRVFELLKTMLYSVNGLKSLCTDG